MLRIVTDTSSPGGHAFISYAREDSLRADQLRDALKAAGLRVWRDTDDLEPGKDWRAEIKAAITDNSVVFLACFSRASLERSKRYQNEELTPAIEQLRLHSPKDQWFIPVRFDDCKIPDHPIDGSRTLSSIQSADLFGDRRDQNTTERYGNR